MVIPGALHPRNRQPSVSQCIVFPPAFHPNTAIHIYTFIQTLFTESFYPLGTYSSPFKRYICGRTNRIFYSLCLTYVKKKSKRAKKSSILFLNATNLVFSPFPRTSIHFLMLCYPKSPAEWQMFSKIKHLSYLIFILSSAKWIDLFQMSRIHRRGRFEKLSS